MEASVGWTADPNSRVRALRSGAQEGQSEPPARPSSWSLHRAVLGGELGAALCAGVAGSQSRSLMGVSMSPVAVMLAWRDFMQTRNTSGQCWPPHTLMTRLDKGSRWSPFLCIRL